MVLAQEYTTLQKALMIARQEAVCVFDKRNAADTYIQDHQQVTVIAANIPTYFPTVYAYVSRLSSARARDAVVSFNVI